MSELDDQMNGAAEEHPSDATGWIERVSEASSDFESIGAEDAAGLGL